MSSIEDRVVQMKFDNAQFEQGIKTSLSSLEALNKGLKLDGATKGLNDVSAAAKAFSLAGIASGIDSIADKFRAMAIVGITALTNIVNKAVDAGIRIAKSLSTDPIQAGLHEYETNLNSIQTILSNTQWQNTGLADVNKALQILNEYSDKTIYNFGEMARNIGTFTAAGVKLDVATNAIKGIANLAAVSGSNAEQASTAMYQLSQALAAGKVSLMDWNSVVTAGMGGKVFQDALMETARVHGVAIDKMVKDAGSFRMTLENGWLTGEVLTETLSKFTGDLTAAQLKTMGYNDQQIAGILKMGQTAQDAATKVKTFSQLLNTLQEAAGSGWSQTWQLIFGDFEQAKTLFTGVNNVLSGFINASADARNKVLGDWNALGGRTVLIEAISLAFNDLLEIITPIKKAFRDIFPAVTGKQLYDLTVIIRNFFSAARLGEDTMTNLRRTFAGVFAILGIGWDVIKEGAKLFARLFGVAFDGSGSFLATTAEIGDFIVGIREAIHNGTGLINFFDKLGNILVVPIQLIKTIAKVVGQLFDGFDGSAAADRVTGFVKSLSPLERLGDVIGRVWSVAVHQFDDIWHFFEPLASKLSDVFHELSVVTGGLHFQDLLSAINTGALVTLVSLLSKFVKSSGKGGGLLGSIKEAIEGVTQTLSTMQNTLRAATLLEIALALGILTLSISVLSKIDSDGLKQALWAIAAMFTQLFISLAVLEKMPSGSSIKLYAMAGAMILLGVAINILAVAVKSLSELGWPALLKGLTGTVVLLGALVTAANFFPDSGKMIATGLGLLILATAIRVLVTAVTDLSGLSWEDMAKGLTGVAVLLTALALYTKFAGVNATGILAGAGLILLATSIKILASAMSDIGNMSWGTIAKGLVTMFGSLELMTAALDAIPPSAPLAAAGLIGTAYSLLLVAQALDALGKLSWGTIGKGLTTMLGALLLMSTALDTIPPSAPLAAAGLIGAAYALLVIAEVLDKMGGMSWSEIGKAMVVLFGSLFLITDALLALEGALPGAAAMLVVAAALAILTPVLIALGNMSWGEITKGLVTLAGVFIILGVAGLVLAEVVPVILLLGASIALIGVGMALAGVGVLAFATGLTALSIAGAAGAAAIVAIASAVIGLIPMLVEQVGLALILLIKIVGEAAPGIVDAVVQILIALLDGIDKITPKLVNSILKLIFLLLDALVQAVPKLVDAGYKMLVGILTGIANNIGQVITQATNVIVNFLKGIGDNLPRVIQAGIDLILSFLRGLTKAINDNSDEMGKAGSDLGIAIVKGMAKGLLSGQNTIIDAAKSVAKAALNAAKNVLGIHSPSKEFEGVGEFSTQGLAKGLLNMLGLVKKSSATVGKGAMDSLRSSLSEMTDVIDGDINLSPTITPVLDLTNIKKNASGIQDLLSSKTITVNTSYESAQDVSANVRNNKQPPPDDPGTQAGTNLTYNQYNNSPKALSPAEIYRQTKNQLSVVKGALPK